MLAGGRTLRSNPSKFSRAAQRLQCYASPGPKQTRQWLWRGENELLDVALTAQHGHGKGLREMALE